MELIDMPEFDLSAAIYFYEQAQKELEYMRALLRSREAALEAAEVGLAHAIDVYDPEEPERFMNEAMSFVHRVHENAEALLDLLNGLAAAAAQESHAAKAICQKLQPPPEEERH